MSTGIAGGAVDEGVQASLEARVEAALEGAEGEPGAVSAAWAALYDALAPDVHGFLLGLGVLGRGEVEDAVQETFVRLVRDLSRWDRARPLRPFVLGVSRHVAIDLLRRRKARQARQERAAAAGARESERPSERVTRREEDQQIQAALAAVEPELRGLLVLRHANQLTLRELAEVCDCSLPTLRERLRRAARRFAVELRQRGVMPGGWSAGEVAL